MESPLKATCQGEWDIRVRVSLIECDALLNSIVLGVNFHAEPFSCSDENLNFVRGS